MLGAADEVFEGAAEAFAEAAHVDGEALRGFAEAGDEFVVGSLNVFTSAAWNGVTSRHTRTGSFLSSPAYITPTGRTDHRRSNAFFATFASTSYTVAFIPSVSM